MLFWFYDVTMLYGNIGESLYKYVLFSYSVLGVRIYTVIFYTDFVPIKEKNMRYCPLLAKNNMTTVYMRMLKF